MSVFHGVQDCGGCSVCRRRALIERQARRRSWVRLLPWLYVVAGIVALGLSNLAVETIAGGGR